MKYFSPALLEHAKHSPSLDGKVKLALKEKEVIAQMRLAAFVVAVLTIVLNLYLINLDPGQSLASSSNDLIRGGIGSSEQFAKSYLSQRIAVDNSDESKILRFFNIQQDDIQHSRLISICTGCSNSQDKVVLGRSPNTHAATPKVSLKINNAKYYYQSLSSAYGNTYVQALRIHPDTYILLSSGNIVFTPKGKISLQESHLDKNGNTVSDHVYITAHYPLRKKLVIQNESSSETNNLNLVIKGSFKDIGVNSSTKKPDTITKNESGVNMAWDQVDPYGALEVELEYTPQYLADKTTWCNQMTVRSLQLDSRHTESCLKIIDGQNLEHYTLSSDSSNQVSTYIEADLEARSLKTNHKITTVKPAEEIVYSLRLHNTSNEDVVDFRPSDLDVSDIMEYAQITDVRGGKIFTNRISWEKVTIEARTSTDVYFTARVFDHLPSTNQPEGNTASYDCVLTASYSDNVTNISLPCASNKVKQQIFFSRDTNLFIATGIVGAIGIVSLGLYYFDVQHSQALKVARSK